MRTSTSPRLKKPPLTKAGETSMIWPATSETMMVSVRGDTDPWERMTKLVCSRVAVATETSSAGGGAAFCIAAGRDWIMTKEITIATPRKAMGSRTFIVRAMMSGPVSPSCSSLPLLRTFYDQQLLPAAASCYKK